MHEKRNFILVLVLAASLVWAVVSWIFLDLEHTSFFWGQRIISVAAVLLSAVWLAYALIFLIVSYPLIFQWTTNVPNFELRSSDRAQSLWFLWWISSSITIL